MDTKNVQDIDCGIARIREYDIKIQSLYAHLSETAEKSSSYAKEAGMGAIGELAGWLHDIGKNTRQFTNYILSANGIIQVGDDRYIDNVKMRGKIDHSTLGAKLAIKGIGDSNITKSFLSQLLALSSVSHHGGLLDCLSMDGIDKYSERLSKEVDKKAYTKLDSRAKERIEILMHGHDIINEASSILDKIQKNYKTEEVYFLAGMIVKFVLSCVIDGDRISTIDFLYPDNKILRNNGSYLKWSKLAGRLEAELAKFKIENEIDVLRKQVSDKCLEYSNKVPGIYQLTVPTGGGKTLSSLRFAINHAKHNNMKRIIYVIPYTSIIDQNAQKAREILEIDESESSRIVLEHHSNLTPDEETKANELLAENWDSPIVFTTMVQFLDAIFSAGTQNIRRFHNMANSVIIFDEIQSIPIKCVYMFNAAINFIVDICKSTVVLCTATQPLLNNLPGSKGKDLSLKITPAQQIVDNYDLLYEKMKRVNVYSEIKPKGWSCYEIANLVEREIEGSQSLLVVVNTKKSAIALYKALKSRSIDNLFYLSTDMCPVHRIDVLDEIKSKLSVKDKKRNEKTICISTQLIEAGVDIDFNVVIRYLAGLDSIAQAAGRCNRHGELPELGKVYIINPADENISRLEDIKIGRDKARRVLDEFTNNPAAFNNDILSIAAIDQYYQYYFYEQADKMSYPRKNSPPLYELLALNQNAVEEYRRANSGNKPKIVLNQSFRTAAEGFTVIDAATRGVIVPYKSGKELIIDLCSETDIKAVYKLIKQAQRYSINLFSNTFNQLWDKGTIYEVIEGTGIYYLADGNYDVHLGLSEGNMPTLSC